MRKRNEEIGQFGPHSRFHCTIGRNPLILFHEMVCLAIVVLHIAAVRHTL